MQGPTGLYELFSLTVLIKDVACWTEHVSGAERQNFPLHAQLH